MSSTVYQPWAVTAGEIPTTAYWNILGSNDASFNTGQGFNDGILVSRHFAAGSVTTPAMKPTYVYNQSLDNGTTTRSAMTVSGIAPGCSINYTTGSTNEIVRIEVGALIQATAGGFGLSVGINGSAVGQRTYYDGVNLWLTHQAQYFFEATANTTYTIGIYIYVTGTLTICNATNDHTSKFDPKISLMAWGKA